MKMIKASFSIKMIVLSVLLLGAVSSIKVENLVQNKAGPDYSKTDTPTVIAEMFKTVKKASKKESTMFDSCMELLLNIKNEELMINFWEKIKKISCNNDMIEQDFFMEYAKNTLEKIKVDGRDEDCRSIVERNILPPSEVEDNTKQKELRLLFAVYFDCKNPYIEKKEYYHCFLRTS